MQEGNRRATCDHQHVQKRVQMASRTVSKGSWHQRLLTTRSKTVQRADGIKDCIKGLMASKTTDYSLKDCSEG
jgi:hypothetical protein